MTLDIKKAFYSFILLTIVLLVTYFSTKPMLTGGFYFDDEPVLSALGNDGGIQSFNHWHYFVFSGTTGLLGRSISMATFTIDALDWPTSAYPFKLTNLIIHLVNGVLIFFLSRLLLSQAPLLKVSSQQLFFIPILTMSIWLLHPLQLSTIVPIVQRMTELSAFFILIGLIVFLKTRPLIVNGNIIQQSTATLFILLSGILATLSKENGILLPLYILIIEYTLFANFVITEKKYKHFNNWKTIILWIPAIIIFFYLGYQFIKPDPTFREFTIWQRFITQPEILFSYLQLLIPQLHVSGYFQDSHPFHNSLLDGHTIYYFISIIVLLILSFVIRRKTPLISFAVLWFFGGHLLESSSIPLELYFEHRNYLPIFGIFFIVSYYILKINSLFILSFIILIIFSLLISITSYSSSIWGNNIVLSTNAILESPSSIRAHQTAAAEWIKLRKPDEARKLYQNLVRLYPKKAMHIMQVLQTSCLLKEDNQEGIKIIVKQLTDADNFKGFSSVANTIRQIITKMKCNQLTYDKLLELLNIAELRILSADTTDILYDKIELENIYITKANIFIDKKEINNALNQFKKALDIRLSYDITTVVAKIYIANNNYNEAKKIIQKIIHKKNKHNSLGLNTIDPRLIQLQNLLKQIDDTKKNNDTNS